MSRSERRGRRRWEQELLREIRALETTDEGPDGGPVEALPDRLPRLDVPRPRRGRRKTLQTLLVTGVVVAAMAVVGFGPPAAGLRSLLGLDPGSGEGTHAFLQSDPRTGGPVGWSPCREIHYEVNPQDAPDGWEELVAEGVARVGEASGLDFVYDGTTDDRGFEERLDRGRSAPVLIGFADDTEVPALEGDVAGLAGPIQPARSAHYTTGRVVLDEEVYDRLDGEVLGERSQLSILMHELGHLVGLDHVKDRGELMYETDIGRPSFGPGDREGLERLGDVAC